MITHPHLLDIEELKTCFFTFEGTATAVDDVSFFLPMQFHRSSLLWRWTLP